MELISVNELLKKNISGKIICFPTDTVYGVGALFDDLEAIEKIYRLKSRDYSKPLAILTASFAITNYIQSDENIIAALKKYWPGALTAIFNKSPLINNKITANSSTIAFRMPDSVVALKILNHFGMLATTSVNISGQLPLNNKTDIIASFNDKIDYLVIEEEQSSNLSSTVIDFTKKPYQIVRQGSVSFNV